MKKIIFILSLICTLTLASCGVRSDEATETMLQGKWVGAYDDFSEELHIEIHCDLKKNTHSFTQTIDFFDLEDLTYLFSISGNGIWHASKDKIEFKTTPASLTYEYSDEIDPVAFGSIIPEIEAEIKKNPKSVSDLLSVTWDSWTERDDEGNIIEYEKVK